MADLVSTETINTTESTKTIIQPTTVPTTTTVRVGVTETDAAQSVVGKDSSAEKPTLDGTTVWA